MYLLKNIKEPLEFSTINDIVVQDGFVNYFDFAICFAELLESNQITELKGDKTLYVISPEGTEAVESVEDKIFVSVKEKALRSAFACWPSTAAAAERAAAWKRQKRDIS